MEFVYANNTIKSVFTRKLTAVCPAEPFLREFKDEENAEDDRNSDLQRLKSTGRSFCQLVGYDIVGSPVDAGPGNQWKDTGNQKNSHRTVSLNGTEPGDKNHEHSSQKSRTKESTAGKQQLIADPTTCASKTTVYIILLRHLE